MPDANCEGHFQVLLRALHDEERREFWHYLNLAVVNFEDLGLASDATDRTVWEQCQQHDVILITANRNDEGPILWSPRFNRKSTSDSLPVITLANVEQIRRNRQHAIEVADRLLDYPFSIDDFRGTGRLFLP
jgi:hypothetical protein